MATSICSAAPSPVCRRSRTRHRIGLRDRRAPISLSTPAATCSRSTPRRRAFSIYSKSGTRVGSDIGKAQLKSPVRIAVNADDVIFVIDNHKLYRIDTNPSPTRHRALAEKFMALGMLGKYERLDVLGHGVSGIVYLAKDTLLNKQVALKEVDVQAGDLRRFLEEARVMDRLRHPNIVRVNGVDRIEGKVVIDMEYVRGKNLQEMLRAEGVLPLDRALDIAAQVLDALDYAHRMQTVHRDIKPANILIGRDGEIKLVDFGLAEILATNAYAGGAGTYAYMAPEDFAEEDRSDSQSDIWAVGVTLYEMVAGQRPFQVAKVKDPFSWKRVLETQLPTPITDYLPDAPPGLRAILDRALERDKSRRYRTAGDFRDDVLRLREGQSLASSTLRLQQEIAARRLADYDLTHRADHKPRAPEYDLTDSMKRAAEAGYGVTDSGPAPTVGARHANLFPASASSRSRSGRGRNRWSRRRSPPTGRGRERSSRK